MTRIKYKSDSQIIYDNYKEPLRATESGHGYLGTVAHTKDGEFIQCYECGELVKSLTTHVKKHKMKPDDYRLKYQLSKGTPLSSKNFSSKKREIYITKVASVANNEKRALAQKKYLDRIRGTHGLKTSSFGSRSLEWHNSNGSCPDQILAKLKDIYMKNGTNVSYDYLSKNHSKLLQRLVRVYGSLNKARKMAGLTEIAQSPGRSIKYTTASMLEALRDFYERYGRTPLSSDLKEENNTPSFATYQRNFRTLNEARLQAGVPILIPLGNRQFVEVLPDNATDKQLEKILR